MAARADRATVSSSAGRSGAPVARRICKSPTRSESHVSASPSGIPAHMPPVPQHLKIRLKLRHDMVPAVVVIQTRMVNGPISELSRRFPRSCHRTGRKCAIVGRCPISSEACSPRSRFPRDICRNKKHRQRCGSSQSCSTRKATKTRDAMPDFLFLFTVS